MSTVPHVLTCQARTHTPAPVSPDTPATTVNTTLTSAPAIPVRTEQHVMTLSMDTTVPVSLATQVSPAASLTVLFLYKCIDTCLLPGLS